MFAEYRRQIYISRCISQISAACLIEADHILLIILYKTRRGKRTCFREQITVILMCRKCNANYHIKTVLQNSRAILDAHNAHCTGAIHVQSGTMNVGRQNARALLTHVGANSPGMHRQGRKRQSQDFAGGILTGYLWKLNPPILLLGEGLPSGLSTSSAFRRVSTGLS